MQTLQASIEHLAHKVDGQRLSEAIADLAERVEALHTDRSLGEAEMRLLRSIRRSLDDLIYQMNIVSAEPEPPTTQATVAPLPEPPPVFGRRTLPPEPSAQRPRTQPGPIETPQIQDRRAELFRPVATMPTNRLRGSELIRRYPLASVAAAACFAIGIAQGLNQFAPRVSDITGSIQSTIAQPRPKTQASAAEVKTANAETAALTSPRVDYAPAPLAAPSSAPVQVQTAPIPVVTPVTAGRSSEDAGGLAAYQAGVRLAEGPSRDYRAAIQMFEKAGDFPAAQFRLALLYERGQGAPKNLAMARTLYQKAAERGNVRAMHNLGVLYADGLDGRPDYATAAEWFRRAAEYGLRDSEYNLATLTARGLGVEKRPANAYTWFALAALQGDAEAARQRDEIAKSLDATSLKAAKAAVENFRPKPMDPSANQTMGP